MGDGLGDSGLLDVIERGRLTRATEAQSFRPFKPTGFDQDLLEIAEAAIASRIPAALVLPVPGTNTSVILAAAILVSDFVRERKLTSQYVLLTKQLRLRRVYDSLHFQQLSISDYFPRTVIGPDGTPSEAAQRSVELRDKPGRLHFASGVERITPALRKNLRGIVIEAHPSFERGLSQLIRECAGRIPLLYLASDPADPLLEDFATNGVIWGWDGATLREEVESIGTTDFVCEDPKLLLATATASYEIHSSVSSTKLDTALATLWDDLKELQHHSSTLGQEGVRWAWGVFGSLSHLIVPIELYDRFARGSWGTAPLAEAANRAESYARNVLNPDHREYWEVLAADLELAVEAARSTNTKPIATLAWCQQLLASEQPGHIVLRNRASSQALAQYLENSPDIPIGWQNRLSINTFSDLMAGRAKMDVVPTLFGGAVASSYAGLLALPTATRLTVMAHGPWESGRILRQIQNARSSLNHLVRGELRQRAERILFSEYEPDPPPPISPTIIVNESRALPLIPDSSHEALWNPFDVKIARSFDRTDSELDVSTVLPHEIAGETVSALFLQFRDGSGFFVPSHLVSRLRNGDIEDVAAKSLVVGDSVVLVDRGARRDLFDVIVDKLENLPEFETTILLIREWHERARRAPHDSGLSAGDILARMGASTAIVSSQTINNWVYGVVHGPQQAEDIRNFGRAVNDTFLESRWESIGRALSTIRSHRRKVGHMLGRVLGGIKPTELEDSGYFDRRLGIHYSDLTEALTVHELVQRDEEVTKVGWQYVNRLLTSEEDREISRIRQQEET